MYDSSSEKRFGALKYTIFLSEKDQYLCLFFIKQKILLVSPDTVSAMTDRNINSLSSATRKMACTAGITGY